MIETSELGGRLALADPKRLETEQRSLYDFIDQKFVPWSREANFAIKIDGGRYVTRECAKSSSSLVVHSGMRSTNSMPTQR